MKQVIVMRRDLNLRRGKQIAQGGHAALTALFGSISMDSLSVFDRSDIGVRPEVAAWIRSGMKKVCVGCDGLAQLWELVEQARAAGLPAYTVTDAGHTEVPCGTITCAAIGPGDSARIDQITGQLKLL